jgi:hypothetical protein
LGADVRFGSKADIQECSAHIRFTPESGHWLFVGCLLSAKSDLMKCGKTLVFRSSDLLAPKLRK